MDIERGSVNAQYLQLNRLKTYIKEMERKDGEKYDHQRASKN